MNKLLLIGLLAFGLSLNVHALSFEEASGNIDTVVMNPAEMTATMKQLSPEDQVKFLARVNAAIEALPASQAEKTAMYLNVNSAALKGAAKGNLISLLAEIFATVPPYALTVLNERFAADLLARNANPARPISDQQVETIAKSLLAKVQERNASNADADVSNTFALLMMLRVAGGTPANLAETLLATYSDPAVREKAATVWIPAALGQDRPQSYDPMLNDVDAASMESAEAPAVPVVLLIAGPQTQVALLSDLSGPLSSTPALGAVMPEHSIDIPNMMPELTDINRRPESDDPQDKWSGDNSRDEPEGYTFQII